MWKTKIKYLNIILVVFFLLFLIICLISELRINKNYVHYKLSNTQYEKLLWINNLNNKNKQNKEPFVVFLGSSITLYGINDSILGDRYLNLAVNTPSREMEFYILEMIIKKDLKIEKVYIEENSKKPSYGLHPVLHYFVKPSWLLKNGQQFFQPHFFNFILKRAQVVFKSYLYNFPVPNFDYTNTNFGCRFLKSTINRNRFLLISDGVDTLTKLEAKKNLNLGFLNNWWHNYYTTERMQTFILKLSIDNNCRVEYFEMPTISKSQSYLVFGNDTIYNNELKIFQKDRELWADPGHLNENGSKSLAHILKFYLND